MRRAVRQPGADAARLHPVVPNGTGKNHASSKRKPAICGFKSQHRHCHIAAAKGDLLELRGPDDDGIIHQLKGNQIGQDIIAALDIACGVVGALLQRL
jgi:hypothetical protein